MTRPTPGTTTTMSTTTATTTGTTTTSGTSLSDSGPANCASDGGTLISNVCRLADGQLNQQYEALIASSGGSGPTPFLFKVVAGSIPPGMQVPADYAIGEHGTIIGGTPTLRGTYSFTIQVTDGAGDTATGQFTLTNRLTSTPRSSKSPAATPARHLRVDECHRRGTGHLRK